MGNFVSRLRRWETFRFDPELTNTSYENIDNWTEIENGTPKLFKNGKLIKNITKRVGKCVKLAIFALGLTLATSVVSGLKDSFNTMA